ncbi:MAG: hypothetical protein WC683_01025 [bacterium]
MTVHVKRGGEWIEAPYFEVGDEILVGGHTPAVVKAVGAGEDGVPQIDMQVVAQRPVDFVRVHFTPCDAPDPAPGRECPACGGFHASKEES